MKNEYERPTAEVIEVELSECFAGSIGADEGQLQDNEISGNSSFEKW